MQTTLDFELRYPLMGGWKVDFTIGKGGQSCQTNSTNTAAFISGHRPCAGKRYK